MRIRSIFLIICGIFCFLQLFLYLHAQPRIYRPLVNKKHLNIPPPYRNRERTIGMPMVYNGNDCNRNITTAYDFDKTPVLISSPNYVWIYGMADYNNIQPCDVNCVVTRDWNENVYHRADGLLFHQTLPIKKACPHQKTIYFTMENNILYNYHSSLLRKHDMSLFSLANTDVYASYFNYAWDLLKPAQKKTKRAIASSYITNCKTVSSERDRVVRDLLKYGVEIDLFGQCFGDLNIPEPNLEITDKRRRKLENMAKYKFNLVFENSMADGYVTEKYWEALAVGTIPIVLGAPDIHRYEPRPGSILVVHDFASIEALATEIKRLDSDQVAYDKMLEWKTLGYSDNFLAMIQYTAIMYECRLCMKIADSMFVQSDPEAILIREANTYYYRPMHLFDFTIAELRQEIGKVFAKYKPSWYEKRPDWWQKPLRIHRIVKSGGNYEQLLWGDEISRDEDVKFLEPGSKLEVIFI